MRQVLAEREFPVDAAAAVRLGALGRAHAALAGRRGHRRGRGDRRLLRAGHRAVLRRQGHLEGAGAAGRRGRRRRDRQLVGLADGPRGPAGRLRGQPARDRATARRASSPTRTAPRWPRCRCCGRCTTRPGWSRLVVATYQAVSGAGLAGVAELDEQVRKVADRAAELTFDGAAVEFPEPARRTPARSPSTCSRWPARSSTTARDETDEEQKLRNESRKILEIPDLQVSGTCVRVPGLHRPLARRSTPAFARPDQPGAGPRAAGRRARRGARRRPDAAAGGRPGPDLRRPDPARRDRRSTAWRCSCSNDNLRKGAALNAVQIAELVAAELPLTGALPPPARRVDGRADTERGAP